MIAYLASGGNLFNNSKGNFNAFQIPFFTSSNIKLRSIEIIDIPSTKDHRSSFPWYLLTLKNIVCR